MPRTVLDEYMAIYGSLRVTLSGYPTVFSGHHQMGKKLASDLQAIITSEHKVVYRDTPPPPDLSPPALLVVSSDTVPSVVGPRDICIFVLTPPSTLLNRGLSHYRLPDSKVTMAMLHESGPARLHIVTDYKGGTNTSIYREGVLGHVMGELGEGVKKFFGSYI